MHLSKSDGGRGLRIQPCGVRKLEAKGSAIFPNLNLGEFDFLYDGRILKDVL